ncbi:MAG: DeoR/GlpR family DNA-binding transcription regulator [Spirochaetaceae bacterium]|jgi:DeoR/GlpR family transcriptional regulator of sugar metabolism|nr:DeoR/GlpR family DNA-binding transcription regulator [Spirochaetaceae bacterium]
MTDKQAERQKKILEIIAEEGCAGVAKLAELMGVSKVTLRSDLDRLEEKGIIRHEKGHVYPGSSDDINNRLTYHYAAKRKIAHRASELVSDGEAVMIESGSCCAILAEELTVNKREVRIITNSAFIAAYIRRLPRAKIVLLGGDYQNDAQVMVGPITRQCAQGFTVDKLFIGTDGFSENGFTGNDHLRAETVQCMALQAREVVILTESEKFSKQGLVPLLPLSKIGSVFTDNLIPPEKEAFLTGHGIKVYKIEI